MEGEDRRGREYNDETDDHAFVFRGKTNAEGGPKTTQSFKQYDREQCGIMRL